MIFVQSPEQRDGRWEGVREDGWMEGVGIWRERILGREKKCKGPLEAVWGTARRQAWLEQ
jgi:hypothetical protein